MIDLAIVFELSKTVINNQRFDIILHTQNDYVKPDARVWFGQVWADLTSLDPHSTAQDSRQPSGAKKGNAGPIPVYEGSLEHLLQIIFTRFQNREYEEGCFLLKAEFGADWFTPIMQHPYCILRHPYKSKSQDEQDMFHPFVLFYLGHNIKEFCAAFHSIGLIPGVNSWFIC
jgi:hypothetical protein